MTVAVAYAASGWKYSTTALGAGGSAFAAPGFDDSGWSTGQSPFASAAGGCAINATRNTTYATGLDLLVRRTITLPASRVTISLGSEDRVWIYWNGDLVLQSNALSITGCAVLGQLSVTISPLDVIVGDNVLAIRTSDNPAGGAFLDVEVTYVDAPDATAGVFADWDGDGFDVGDHDDLSSNVVSWTITRGSGAEITGGSQPGSATLILKNPSDIYNPRNASSPLYGLLRDGVPVWIGPNSDGVLTGTSPRGLFGGRITDISLIPSPGTADPATVEILCEDMLGWAQREPVSIDYVEGIAHGDFREAALVSAGEHHYDLASEIHTMPLSHADSDLRSVLDGINAVNGTRHLAKPADYFLDWFTYTTRNRQYGLAGVASETLSASSQHVTGTDGWRLSADTVTNRQRATVTPIRFTPASFTVWQADVLPFTVTEDRPFTRIVDYDDAVSGSTLDIASTGDAVISVYTPFSTGGKIELTVAPGDEATITALSVEGRLARRLEQQSHEANDTTSQAAPRGIREGSEISNEYSGVIASAAGMAEHVVWRYGDPQLRPSLTVENWFPKQFELDLYDVIAFTSTHLGMTARLFEIVGVTHQGIVAASTVQYHTVTYVLQESRVQAPYDWFVLDASHLDSTDHLAY